MTPTLGLIGTPSAAGAHSPGLEKAPAALRAAGLLERLRDAGVALDDRGDLPLVPFAIHRGHPRGHNLPRVEMVARTLADATEEVVRAQELPLIIGADCTVLIGALAGYVRVVDRVGLVYLDAHPDLNTPDSAIKGALDWMGMAHVLGAPTADSSLSHLGPRFPLLSWGDVVFFGAVETELTDWERDLLTSEGGLVCPATAVAGHARQAAAQAADTLRGRADRFLVHFDVDVIDFVDFPIADDAYQRNQGLSVDDAMAALSVFAGDPAFGGLVITEVNPDHAVAEDDLLQQFVPRLATSLGSLASPRSRAAA
jgi:arginase